MQFRDIHHQYGAEKVLDGVSFEAPAGKITCLLGESGSGKTTLLRLAGGMLPIQRGELVLGGEVLATPSHCPSPEERPVGLVFQDGALFPHLNVAANISFGLKKGQGAQARVEAMLARVGLAGFAKRYPHTLSGGQQQRVALARALAPSPALLLMDEPFASIDIQRRRALREDVRRLLVEEDLTVLLVTHDPDEAIAMADHIVVLDKGRVAQQGSPGALFRRPATPLVATLMSGAQMISARLTKSGVATDFGEWPLSALHDGNVGEGPGQLAVAPRSVATSLAGGEVTAQVVDCRDGGDHFRIRVVAKNGQELLAQSPEEVPAGTMVGLRIADGAAFFYPSATP